MEVRSEPRIRFVCEQEGIPERELKTALIPALVSAKVARAYLARVDYGDATAYEVALSLRGSENLDLVKTFGEHFASLFGQDAHLDTLFLSDAQEAELRKACSAFYSAA